MVNMATTNRVSLIASLLDEMINNPNCQYLKLSLYFDGIKLDLTAKTTVVEEDNELQ